MDGWSWVSYTGARRVGTALCRKLEKLCGGAEGARTALEGGLVGAAPEEDGGRPLLVPTWDAAGRVVSAVRVDPTGKREPTRVGAERTLLVQGTPVWGCSREGGVADTLAAARGGTLALTVAPLDVLAAVGAEAGSGCVLVCSRRSVQGLVDLVRATTEVDRPAAVVVRFARDLYPAQVEELRALVRELRFLPSVEERAEERAAEASKAQTFALPDGRVAWLSRDERGLRWREGSRASAVNVLVGAGWSVAEARAAVPALPVAVDFTFDARTSSPVVRRGGETFLNLFRGMPVRPRDVPWPDVQALLQSLTGGDAAGLDWLLDWLAAPLQSLHQGVGPKRCLSSVILHGDQGTGKGFLGEILRVLYGEHYVEIGQGQLEDAFEPKRFASCLFLTANEIECRTRAGKGTMGRLKAWVTEPKVSVRRMHKEADEAAIWFNMLFMANSDDPVPLEESDRRFSVWYRRGQLDGGVVERLRADKARGWPQAAGFLRHLLSRDVTRDLWRPYDNADRRALQAVGMEAGRAFLASVKSEGLLALSESWVLDELSKDKRAGVDRGPPQLHDGGFVLLATLTAIHRCWCKDAGVTGARSSMAMRRLIETAWPQVVWGRGRVAGGQGLGCTGIPIFPGDLRVVDGGRTAEGTVLDFVTGRPVAVKAAEGVDE